MTYQPPESVEIEAIPKLFEAVRAIREWEDSDEMAYELATRLFRMWEGALKETAGQ